MSRSRLFTLRSSSTGIGVFDEFSDGSTLLSQVKDD